MPVSGTLEYEYSVVAKSIFLANIMTSEIFNSLSMISVGTEMNIKLYI